jgi:phosphate transport system permease protein
MPTSYLVLLVLVLAIAGFMLGRSRALATAGGTPGPLHSVPGYYGFYVAIWAGIPALLLVLAWLALEPVVIKSMVLAALPEAQFGDLTESELELAWVDIRNLATGNIVSQDPSPALRAAAEHYQSLHALSDWTLFLLGLVVAIGGLVYTRQQIRPAFRARNRVETVVNIFLIVCSTIAIFTTLGIVLSLLFEALRFFGRISPFEFLFGLHWSPQTAIREDQVGASGAFGMVPLFVGTLLISAVALLVAVPLGLMSAVYLSDYAPKRVRSAVKPILEILAGIPTVVYGFFAILTVAPFFRDLGESIGLDVSANSAIAAGVVMGIMIVPFVSSLSDDVINSVPQSLRDGSYALGATKSETVRTVILPAALPGIVGAVLLAASRAIGETMIVLMAAGLAANLTANPFEAVTTVTVQIATILVGDQEFDSAKTLSAFALGLVLFVVTLCLNVIALRIVNKYREKYD